MSVHDTKISDFTNVLKAFYTKLVSIIPTKTSQLENDSGYKTTDNTLTNNLLATVPGTALDAVQGKVLDDKIEALNASLGNVKEIYIYRTSVTFTLKNLGYSLSLADVKLDIPDDCPFTPSEVFTQPYGLCAFTCSSGIVDDGKISVRFMSIFSASEQTITLKVMLIK